ncbi:MAG: N-6 DNA methylase [Bacteroidaceae bacterium]|mgnify:CR=1 FL=1|nr:N-6 DNA methylase [Bacteroidaceae bacterium]
MADNTYNRMIKHSGQVFTPDFLVVSILDYAGYVSGNILEKHVIDNSCGDGAFLCELTNRYCKEYIAQNGTKQGLKEDLEKYIHGIELDPIAFENCLFNLSLITQQFGIVGVTWDILNTNALSVSRFQSMMDFVVGNPPYVRVHNLEEDYEEVKSFYFAQDGMTDLYLVFYELGLRMLNKKGKLCYITPSSWLSSLAATKMRQYIMTHRSLVGLIDLGHYQAFQGATTYTMIALFDLQHRTNRIDYYSYSENSHERIYEDTFSYEDMMIGSNFYVGSRTDLSMVKAIKTAPTHRFAQVKNGFATLADRIFIKDVTFQALTIPILKASTGKWTQGFFPYDTKGKPLSKEEIFSHPEIAEYLEKNKAELLKKKTEEQVPDWYLYGRTQALKDVYSRKYSINTIIKEVKSIKLIDVPVGSGLYSGLYILTEVPFEIVECAIKSEEFINYLSILKNYKSGGYYTYSSKDLEQYLNYKISQHELARDFIPADERSLFEGCF